MAVDVVHPHKVHFSNNYFITIYSDLHNSMAKIILEASVAVISTVEQ